MAEEKKTPNVGYIRPEVLERMPDWALIRDCIAGQRAIKEGGKTYLPEILASPDTVENEAINEKYLARARFFNVTGRTVEELTGEVFIRETKFELPDSIQMMAGDIDGAGTTFEQQAKAVLGDVLGFGRSGLLVDFPTIEEGEVVTKADLENGGLKPKILFYQPEQVINWTMAVDRKTGNKQLQTLVLFEQEEIAIDEFEKKFEDRWRVYRWEQIQLENSEESIPAVSVEVYGEVEGSRKNGKVQFEIVEPKRFIFRYDRRPLGYIPFIFLGSENNDERVDRPPLIDLANTNIAHYQNSADVEWSAFHEGQTGIAISGLTEEWADRFFKNGIFFGGGNALLLPQGGKAEMLQANSTTMSSELMKDKVEQMKAIGGRLIEAQTVEKTAFEAGLDKTGEVSVLSSIANNVSSGYVQAFTIAEEFLNEPSGNVKVELNTEYDFGGLTAQEFTDGYFKGIFSLEEVRDNARRKGAKLTDDEIAKASIAGDNPTGEI
jgi:hypothetical protein